MTVESAASHAFKIKSMPWHILRFGLNIIERASFVSISIVGSCAGVLKFSISFFVSELLRLITDNDVFVGYIQQQNCGLSAE